MQHGPQIEFVLIEFDVIQKKNDVGVLGGYHLIYSRIDEDVDRPCRLLAVFLP